MTHASTFVIEPLGRFSLDAARDFAGGFPAGIGARASGSGLLATFPVEGWAGSAAVDVWEARRRHASTARSMARRTSRPSDARSPGRSRSITTAASWEAVGRRDPVLGAVQARFDWLRPVCFYSAYEAATSFVIGQRISMRQGRIVKERLAASLGDEIEVDGTVVRAFPRPERLLEATDVPGLSSVKVGRLHDLARAAIDGRLDTERLRALPEADALAELMALPGVGPWTAQAILTRGCGPSDALPLGDEISRTAVGAAYGLPEPPDDATWTRIAEAWRPYRMWATVLLHMAWRRDQPATPSYRQRAGRDAPG